MADAGDAKTTAMEAEKKDQSLPFFQLFSYADRLDWLLMAGGSLGAVIHGSAMPVFFLLFGNLVNGFGKNQHDLHKMIEEVSKVQARYGHSLLAITGTTSASLARNACIFRCNAHSSLLLPYSTHSTLSTWGS